MGSERSVHVVDDDPAVRRALERLLSAAGFEPVGYPSGFEFLEAAPRLAAGCVLLDLRMPGMDGLELQAELGRLGCPLPVIIVTGDGDVPTAVRAIKSGAVDFVEKPIDEDGLIEKIEAALAGCDAGALGAAAAAKRIAALSRREHQVLDALVAGRQSKAIAYDLGLSVRTVEVHRARMMKRLGIRCLAEAIRLAVLAGFAPDARPAGEISRGPAAREDFQALA